MVVNLFVMEVKNVFGCLFNIGCGLVIDFFIVVRFLNELFGILIDLMYGEECFGDIKYSLVDIFLV